MIVATHERGRWQQTRLQLEGRQVKRRRVKRRRAWTRGRLQCMLPAANSAGTRHGLQRPSIRGKPPRVGSLPTE